MRTVTVTLAVGTALTIAVGAVTLTRSPPRVLRVNEPEANISMGITQANPAICQSGETLSAGTTAVRISLDAFLGARVRVVAYRGGQVVTEGRRAPTWGGTSVTVPVRPVAQTVSGANFCFEIGPNSQFVIIPGHQSPPSRAAVALQSGQLGPSVPTNQQLPLKGRVVVEDLGDGRGTWWSRIRGVARHMGLGHFVTGKWIPLLAAALMAAVGALALRLALREQP
jgi:hypothetical protein